jgi:branched-chain amino acid aminotransferase
MEFMFPYVFVDGAFVELADAYVSPHTNALSYGTGTFEGIRAFWDDARGLSLFAATEHYDRMHRSARILGMKLPYSSAELVDASIQLLQRNGVREDAYLRPLLIAASETLQVRLHDLQPRFSIAVTPMGLNYINPNGVRCIVSTWRRSPDLAMPNRAKVTGGYIGPAMAKSEALLSGADEAIMLNMNGHVAEATTTNIFMRVGDCWITPPVDDDILEGVTRAELMVLIDEILQQQVVERSIDRSELYVADELLLCGTAAFVVPVIAVDGREIGTGRPGDATLTLQRTLLAIARREDARHNEWCTPV